MTGFTKTANGLAKMGIWRRIFYWLLHLGASRTIRGYFDPETGEFVRVEKYFLENGKRQLNPEWEAYYVQEYRITNSGPVKLN